MHRFPLLPKPHGSNVEQVGRCHTQSGSVTRNPNVRKSHLFKGAANKMSDFNHLSKCFRGSIQGETRLAFSDLKMNSGRMSSPCIKETTVYQFLLPSPTSVCSQTPTLRLVWLKSRTLPGVQRLRLVVEGTFFL